MRLVHRTFGSRTKDTVCPITFATLWASGGAVDLRRHPQFELDLAEQTLNLPYEWLLGFYHGWDNRLPMDWVEGQSASVRDTFDDGREAGARLREVYGA